MKEQLEKELEKLDDLEFEYKLAVLTKQDEDIIKFAKAKLLKQAKVVDKLSQMVSNEQKEENSVNVQGEEKTLKEGNK